jgi:uncharacterized protein
LRPAGVHLVVAHSGRMLAASAARGGQRIVVLDQFGDRDTHALAGAAHVVRSRDGAGTGFDPADLLATAAAHAPPHDCAGLVYGAGFEDDPDTLRALARGRTLYGNPPDVVARLKAPLMLAALLDRLGIRHPPTRLDPPADRAGWLVKRAGASGGGHVARADAVVVPMPGTYYQRRVEGRSLSVLFLADGSRALVLGVSEQWVRGDGARPYAFAGAAGPIALAQARMDRLRGALDRLVAATGLRGCNSADLVVDDAQCAMIEINPRPSATLDLYDADWPDGLFALHLRACRGRLPAAPSAAPRRARALAVVYAARRIRVPAAFRFPDWCSDLPGGSGSGGDALIDADQPVCTVHADGEDAGAARRAVAARAGWIAAQWPPCDAVARPVSAASAASAASAESVLGAGA